MMKNTMMMMMTTLLAATTLTVVMGADATDIDQCQLIPYSDQCLDECGGQHESIACPLSDLAHAGWAKGLWSDDHWGLDDLHSNVATNAVNNAQNMAANAVNNVWGGWGKGANDDWMLPAVFCDGPCGYCAVPCGGSVQNYGSCMSSCDDWTANVNVPNVVVPNVNIPNVPKVPDIPDWSYTIPDVPEIPNWTNQNWNVWAKSVGIEDYNGTSTGTWSDEDADVIVPAAAGGDTAVTAASAEESSSSMGAASSLALLVVATATIATTMMM